MSIQEDLTGIDTSETAQATNDNSVVHISGIFKGVVRLQIAPSGTTNWLSILSVSEPRTTPLLTPDNTMDYRFISELDEGIASVYFGN